MPQYLLKLEVHESLRDWHLSAFLKYCIWLVFSSSRFLDVSKTILTFAETFELENGFPFTKAIKEVIVAYRKGYKCFPGAILAIRK